MPVRTYQINQLTEKMLSPDQDFRFMALNDLMTEIANDPHLFQSDEQSEVKVITHVLKLVEDKISEVKNQAVKCLGQLIKIIKQDNMNIIVDNLIEFTASKEEELRDIAGLALKTIVSELPTDSKIAEPACQKLVPMLLKQLQNTSTPPETMIETLSTLSILVTRFPRPLSRVQGAQPVDVLTPLTAHSRPAVRKRAVTTLAQFLPIASPDEFNRLIKNVVVPSLTTSTPLDKQRTTVQLIGAIARYSSSRFGPVLSDVLPGVLSAATKDDADLREGCMQSLEALVLRCPTEVTPYLNSIISLGNELIKYDPNYAAPDDEDEEMEDAGDDDEEDELDDPYSDDEDTSYKVRRSATKLLGAIIATRPELLVTLYRTVSPVLISRFGDREESVKLEVWSTYGLLIKQTGVYGGSPQAKTSEGGKRKRDHDGMEVEDAPSTLLKSQVPGLSKALLKQLQGKAHNNALQAGFNVLHSLLLVSPGSLASSSVPLMSLAANTLSQPSSSNLSVLQATVLSFVTLFVSTHPPSTYVSTVPTLTAKLLNAAKERHPRVTSEAFSAFSALLKAMKPLKPSPETQWVDDVYEEAVSRLRSNETDPEVRSKAEDIIADLWLTATDIVNKKEGKEWEALLKGSTRTEGAVRVVTKVAEEIDMGDSWVGSSVEWVIGLLRRSGKTGKAEAFGCLEVLLKRFTSGIPPELPSVLIPELLPLISTSDLVLLSHSLTTLTILLVQAPTVVYPIVESKVVKPVYDIAYSPLVSGSALDSLTDFFRALVEADREIATHVVPGLTMALEKSNAPDASPANISKCLSAIVKGAMGIAAGVIAEFSKAIKKASKSKEIHVVLSLLTLGEIGRYIDMSTQSEVFNNALALFTAEAEPVRAAAAFAVGNIAIGNIHQFLPIIVKQVQTSNEMRLLSLHALKEVVTHSSHAQLETVAEMLWVPLFENSDNSEETTRNVAAACLGKLTTTNPSQYLPQLQVRLDDSKPSVRATVVAAIRYTFAETDQSYDELLSPLIVQFLSLVHDPDLTVRRLSLSSLNAAARNKPNLIREHLSALMPLLYAETAQKKELIRIVEMGPWKHRVDDGLEARKTAYETMYTILDTCLERIDIHDFLGHVLNGLKDEANEVKVLCHMMLFRLAQVAPMAVSQRLDEAAPELSAAMKGAAVTKDTVKQDLERTAELQRSTLRAIAALSKINTPGTSPQFDALVEQVSRTGPWAAEFRELL
ncbi:hypothetical protein FRC03_000633 [Tulasnella sp. 419]|nr:hypothetical protein FRC02_004351 [Tulasnella sp. 418]KAG8969807.1 hypothetical protein FRC03_000633 [Tulasnella sp. 419]